MKPRFPRFFLIALFASSAPFAFAGDFQSVIISPGTSSATITVPSERYLTIQNFTQDGGSTTRGLVTITISGASANVLAASLVGSATTPPVEPVNHVVIAGPATVTASCPSDATTCVVSYIKNDG